MNNELNELRKDLQERMDRISLRLSEAVTMRDELDCVITVALLEEYAKGIRKTELFNSEGYERFKRVVENFATVRSAYGKADDVETFIARQFLQRRSRDDTGR